MHHTEIQAIMKTYSSEKLVFCGVYDKKFVKKMIKKSSIFMLIFLYKGVII